MITKLSEDKENVPLQDKTIGKEPGIIATPAELILVTHPTNAMPNSNMLVIKMKRLLKTQWASMLEDANVHMFAN